MSIQLARFGAGDSCFNGSFTWISNGCCVVSLLQFCLFRSGLRFTGFPCCNNCTVIRAFARFNHNRLCSLGLFLFHPRQSGSNRILAGYFGIVLGTIGMGFAWRYASQVWQVSHWLGDGLVILAMIIWGLLTSAFIARLIRFPHSVLAEVHLHACAYSKHWRYLRRSLPGVASWTRQRRSAYPPAASGHAIY